MASFFINETTNVSTDTAVPVFSYSLPLIIYVSVAIQILLLSAIFIGNLWVIILIARFRRLRNSSNLFTASMAVADFLLSIALIPGVKVTFNPSFVNDINGCLMLWCSQVFASTMSVLSLLCLSLDRFVKIVKPLRYHALITERKALVVIAIIWLYGFSSVVLPPFVGLRNDGVFCFDFARVFNIYHIHYMFVFNGLGPFLTLLVIYFYMFKLVREKKRTSAEYTIAPKVKQSIWRKELKTLSTLAVIVGFTGCAWLPSITLVLLDLHFPTIQASLTIRTVLSWFTYLNSVVNPILYALRSEQFREASKELFYKDLALVVHRLSDSRSSRVYPSSSGTTVS